MKTSTQDFALALARQVISDKRAREIIQLKNFQHGICGCLNAKRPEVGPITVKEEEAIKELWMTLDGSSSWMSALFLLASDQ